MFSEVNLAQVRITHKSLYLTKYVFNAFPPALHTLWRQLYFIHKLVFSARLCCGYKLQGISTRYKIFLLLF